MQKPEFVEQVVVEAEDPNRNPLLVVDNRDERLISPFQNWLVDEIMSEAASSSNVPTERDQVMPPNSGYHCSLFAFCTLKGIKAVLLSPCSRRQGAHVLSGIPMQAVPYPTRLFSRSCGRSCSITRPPTWLSRSSVAMRSY